MELPSSLCESQETLIARACLGTGSQWTASEQEVGREVLVNDRSIWPDRDGGCPAVPPACLTSLAAIRAAQRKGQVGPDIPTNAYFFFSVHPEAR
jgi:hypothetical protein